MQEPIQCKLSVDINSSGVAIVTYPDCMTTPLYDGDLCYSNMSLCYENQLDSKGHATSYWTTRDNVSIKVFKQTTIIDEYGYGYISNGKILMKLIIPPKTRVHGIDPVNIEKYKLAEALRHMDKFRADKAYVYSQKIYVPPLTFVDDWNQLSRNDKVSRSVSIYNNDFIYKTGSLVIPNYFFPLEHSNCRKFKINGLPRFDICEAGIHFFHNARRAEEYN